MQQEAVNRTTHQQSSYMYMNICNRVSVPGCQVVSELCPGEHSMRKEHELAFTVQDRAVGLGLGQPRQKYLC